MPPAELIEYEGRLWYAVPEPDSDWIHLGVAPMPRTTWQTFVYHVCHGFLMRYPLVDVLVFSWRNRRSFVDPEIADAIEWTPGAKTWYSIHGD